MSYTVSSIQPNSNEDFKYFGSDEFEQLQSSFWSYFGKIDTGLIEDLDIKEEFQNHIENVFNNFIAAHYTEESQFIGIANSIGLKYSRIIANQN